MTATLAEPTVFGTRLAGGTVMAERQPDGSILVRGLPIFSEVRETDPGAIDGTREVRDRAWLEEALRRHQERRAMGHMPPMNLRHIHDNPKRVGTYQLTHLALADVNPNEPPRWTLFGDKIYLNEALFAEAADYDYRSPEISPDAPQELAALALLKDVSPFNKYPNVTEKLAPELREAFAALVAEVFRSQIGTAPQTWRGGVESFGEQPRDKDGKWSEGSGGGGKAASGGSVAERIAASKARTAALREEAAKIRKDSDAKNAAADSEIKSLHAKTAAAKEKNAELASKAADLKQKIAKTKSETRAITKQLDREDNAFEGGTSEESYNASPSSVEAADENHHETEGRMAETEAKTTPSLEERMEAMAAKCFEGMAKKFEAMFEAATKKHEEPDGDEGHAPEHAEAEAEKKEDKKVESAQASGGPNDMLPPAVSQARPGESFAAAAPQVEAFSAKLAIQEQTILGLRSKVEAMEREKAAVSIVAAAKKSLLDMGAPSVSEAFEQAAYKAAVKDGQKAVDTLIENVKIGMGLQSQSRVEAFGALASGAAAQANEDDGYKKALETFGARPESKRLIDEMYADWRSTPEHFRRSVMGGKNFFDICRGEPRVNAGARSGEVIRG